MTSYLSRASSAIPKLGILDNSNGPSGLSRYLQMLWPMLTGHFEVIVFGDPSGPYAEWAGSTMVPLPASLLHTHWKTVEVGRQPSQSASASRSILRSAYLRFAPNWTRRKLGLTKNADALAKVLRTHDLSIAMMPLCDLEYYPLAASMAGVRERVGTFHLPPPVGPNFATATMLRSMLRRLTRSIAVSERIGTAWTSLAPHMRGTMTVIPNGIDEIPLHSPLQIANALRRWSLDGLDQPLWIAAGRLTEQKGFSFLIDAVAKLRREQIPITVAIAGEGPEHTQLEDQIRQKGLEKEIRLLGQVEELSILLQAADGFVLSSISEAMPYALLEAMVIGLPVVATAVGGVPELVKNQVTGVLCDSRSPAQLAAGLQQCVTDHEFAKRVADAGRVVVRQRFSAESMRQKTLEVLGGGAAGTSSRSNGHSNAPRVSL
jgi:glycosyltransferase involved in cell wall biosynthesis